MAHDAATRQKARGMYVYDRMDLTKISEVIGVSVGTLRRWRKDAEKIGDDWDKARHSASLAHTGFENMVEVLLEEYIQLHQTVIQQVRDDPEAKPLQKASALAAVADAFNKTVNAAGRASPQLSQLAIAQDVLKRLADFITTDYPQNASAFLEMLEPFGRELSAAYG